MSYKGIRREGTKIKEVIKTPVAYLIMSKVAISYFRYGNP